MKITNKRLQPGDVDCFVSLIRVFERVFEMKSLRMPPEPYLKRLLERPDFIVLVAMDNDEVVGGLTSYVLSGYFSEKSRVYLYDLAVRTDFQRKGIGRNLIADLNSFCRSQDFEEVFVQAEKADDYAVDFYRKTGITNEEAVVHFVYTLSS